MEEKLFGQNGKCIIVTGPESTGKSTIALELANRFLGTYLPEFAREYIETLKQPYTYQDIANIAETQRNKLKTLREEGSNNIIFADTYLIITKVWMLWNANKYEEWIDLEIQKTKNCLYLLCAPDIEWVADNVRENGGESRNKLFTLYLNELQKHGLNYKVVEGIGKKRMENASSWVKEYLNNH